MPQAILPLLDELLRTVTEFDQMIGEMTGGRPSHHNSDDHADQAVELCERIVRAARGPGRTLSKSR